MRDYHKDLAYDVVMAIGEHWTDREKGSVQRKIARVLRDKLAVMTADIHDFHEKFGLAYQGPPRFLSPDLHEFRHKFMQEELDEYNEAYEKRDMAGQFDALIDLAYVLFGTNHLHGFPFAEGWRRVQAANMAKIRVERAEDSKRGSTFDVVKPEGWTAPDLTDLLPAPKDQPDLF